MNRPTNTESSPEFADAVGGQAPSPPPPSASFITRSDFKLAFAAIVGTAAVMLYLHDQLNEINDAVHVTARDVAVVKEQISALRSDVERLKSHAVNFEPNFVEPAVWTTSHP